MGVRLRKVLKTGESRGVYHAEAFLCASLCLRGSLSPEIKLNKKKTGDTETQKLTERVWYFDVTQIVRRLKYAQGVI